MQLDQMDTMTMTMSNKRLKQKLGKEESGSDHISCLPDEVLVSNILCLLPLVDAARTTVLSRRWRPLFHGIPRLVFDSSINLPGAYDEDIYTKWWETVLHVVCSRSKREHSISPSCVFLSAQTINHAQADQVFKFLFQTRGVQIFGFIDRGSTPNYLIPRDIYTCSSLVHLHLLNCTLKLPDDFVGLPRLKFLKLFCVSISKIELETFVSRCKGLEEFYLYLLPDTTRPWKDTLNLSSNSLVSIDFHKFSLDEDISLKGVGPSLRRVYLALHTRRPMYGPVLCRERHRFVQLLTEFGSVESLSFETTELHCEVLGEMPKRLPGSMLLINLKKLVLLMNNVHTTILHHFLLFLLRSSPNLEELVIELQASPRPTSPIWYSTTALCPHYSFEDQDLIACVTEKLKHVKLRYSCYSVRILDFAKFLLKNAKALEKMMIEYTEFPGQNTMNFEELQDLQKSYATKLELAYL